MHLFLVIVRHQSRLGFLHVESKCLILRLRWLKQTEVFRNSTSIINIFPALSLVQNSSPNSSALFSVCVFVFPLVLSLNGFAVANTCFIWCPELFVHGWSFTTDV